ncbi:hypothetical protein Scep_023735 [Stephania cephalantha]|uniref:Retrotransposon Copia-like N-terminal domain-containing protein n=1 Tax=Stephania cephalantha TaxID=152367 RepID=A0AAP0HXS2_9MAGN
MVKVRSAEVMEGDSGEYEIGSTSVQPGSTISHNNSSSTNAPFGNSLNQFITMKLDDTNFLLWKATVVPVIERYDLDGYLFGSLPCLKKVFEDGSLNPEYKFWFSRDRMLYGWLMTTLSKDVASNIVNPMIKQTAHQLWMTIETYYGANNQSQVYWLQKLLQTTKKGSMKMQAYLSKMKGIADTLAVFGSPVNVEYLISNCLVGLDVEYLAITSILQRLTNLTWPDFSI